MMKTVFKRPHSDPRERRLRFRLYPRGWLIFLLTLGAASGVCALLQRITSSDVHVPMIFVLAVLIVSLATDGYFYGLLAAAVSVMGVNYAFTYPYMQLNFTIYGYPLTFFTMLTVGIACSTLASTLRLQEQQRVQAERERVRANLLRAVSHDLRTPLTSISGVLTTVLEEGESLSPQTRDKLLLGARQDADWLCGMVENLLSVTRISADTGGILKRTELLEEVLSEAVQRFHKRYESVPVSVSVPDEALLVPMDAMLVEQVLMNLLDNAVTHGGQIGKISVEAVRAGGDALITVRDDGCGIPESLLPRLFDGNLNPGGGNCADDSRFIGIGLSVCRSIVEAHGGRIRAENAAEGGAVFRFTLPLEGEEHDDP